VFRLFTPLFNEFDSIIAAFCETVSSRVMVAITPVLSAALTLWFVAWGIMVMRGTVQEPIRDYVWRFVRSSMILSFALSGAYYQSTVAELVRSIPDELAAAVTGGEALLYTVGEHGEVPLVIGTATAQGALIDVAAGKGLATSMDALQKGSILSEDGIAFLTFGVLILLATVALVAVGGSTILVAKVVLGILVALGPLFIAALLFDSTRRFFEKWVAMVATYSLLIVLFAVLFTFMLGIFEHYMTGMKFDGTVNVVYGIGGALILTIVTILVLKEARVLAMGLAGGFALGHIRREMVIAPHPGSHVSAQRPAPERRTGGNLQR
jgi:type IV secretion system protein VirB6